MNKKNLANWISIAVITLSIIFSGCVKEDKSSMTPIPASTQTRSTGPSVTERTEVKEILMVIAPKNFRDEELFVPKKVFEEKGMNVTIAGTSTNVARGMLGGTVKPDLSISEAKADEYDAVVVVGGVGAQEYLWENKELRVLVKDANKQNKSIAAICLAPVVLAKAGIMNGKKSTVFPAPDAISELKKNGAIYEDKQVVVSDMVITGKGPESAKEFAMVLADALMKRG